MATVRPRLRLAVLCAYITPDSDGLPFALNCPMHTIRIPFANTEAQQPRKFILYTQLQNASGDYEFTVEVRNEHGEVANPNEPRRRVTFPGTEHRVVPLEQVFELDVVFRELGVYFFRVLCDGRSLHEPESSDDRPFPPSQLNVLGD
jgi:hypothetical protein